MMDFRERVQLLLTFGVDQRRAELRQRCRERPEDVLKVMSMFAGLANDPERFWEMPGDWQDRTLPLLADHAALAIATALVEARADAANAEAGA